MDLYIYQHQNSLLWHFTYILKIINSGIDKNVVYDVLEKIDRNEYKRNQVAPGVKLTNRAFGKDRRMPITNTYKRERN